MPLPRWEARSGQEAGPCPARGEGALADDDITDQVQHKGQYHLPKVGSRRKEFSVFTSFSSLDINLEQTARKMRDKQYIFMKIKPLVPALWASVSLPLFRIFQTAADVHQKVSQHCKFFTPANDSIPPSLATFDRYVVGNFSILQSQEMQTDRPVAWSDADGWL